MDYMSKLKKHNRLNDEDIKQFVLEQTEILGIHGYVTDVIFKSLPGEAAIYDNSERKIYIDNSFEESFDYKFNNYRLNRENDQLCSYNDLYNLYLFSIVFHELWHALQVKKITMQEGTDYLKFIKASMYLGNKDHLAYRFYHDHFYHEYDANIHSMMLTIELATMYDFDVKALNVINKSFAGDILRGYGIDENKGWGYNNEPPLYYIGEIYKKLNDDNISYQYIEPLIKSYKCNPNKEIGFDSIIIGDYIPQHTKELLIYIRDGLIKTSNIIENLESNLIMGNMKKYNNH